MEVSNICSNNIAYFMKYYEKILLIDAMKYSPIFYKLKAMNIPRPNMLILSVIPNLLDIKNVIYYQISKEEFCQIIGLYFTYEFSDKFFFISESDINYASLHYMVDVGILSIEEFFSALLS